MRAFPKWAAFGALAAVVSLSACASSPEGEAASAAQAGMNQDPPEVAHMAFLRDALGKVALRSDQKAVVEQLFREADARHDAIRQARLGLAAAIADQVALGKIDRALLKPQIDALLQAIEQSRPADRVALGRLHDILDRDQRNQFVDAALEHFQHGRHDHPRMQRAQLWATDLHLSDQQRDQIRASLKGKFGQERDAMREQWRAMREQGKQMLESFRQDQFTPDANAPIFGRDKIGRGLDRMIDFAEAAVPFLTPDQRQLAAQKVRARGGPF